MATKQKRFVHMFTDSSTCEAHLNVVLKNGKLVSSFVSASHPMYLTRQLNGDITASVMVMCDSSYDHAYRRMARFLLSPDATDDLKTVLSVMSEEEVLRLKDAEYRESQ